MVQLVYQYDGMRTQTSADDQRIQYLSSFYLQLLFAKFFTLINIERSALNVCAETFLYLHIKYSVIVLNINENQNMQKKKNSKMV